MALARRDHCADLPQPPIQVTRVSVIIPCYNREDLVGATLDSVHAQTFGDWEAIVVDDHSQDNSVEVARSYAQSDNRIRVVSRQRQLKGGSICRNEGLALARGDYIIFLDSDDLLCEECMQHRVAAMDRASDCGFGVFQTELFTQIIGDRSVLWNAFIDANDLHRFLSLDSVWATTGPIWRKTALEGLGGFDEEALSFQDWELHIRALIAGIKYFKKAVRDNFHRHAYSDHKTITGVKDKQKEHLVSHQKLFTKIFHALREARLLDEETQTRLAGAFWWLAGMWESQGNLRAALSVWYNAASLGLCSWQNYFEGWLVLALYSRGRGEPIIHWLKRSWPRGFTSLGSPYHFNAPM